MTYKSATVRIPSRRTYTRVPLRRARYSSRLNTVSFSPSALKMAGAVFAMVLLFSLAIFLSYRLTLLASNIEQLEQNYKALELENRELSKAYAKLTSHEKLVELGKRLHMAPPNKRQIFKLSN